jgi:hypothetical protein
MTKGAGSAGPSREWCEGAPGQERPGELQARIGCKGKDAETVLGELGRALAEGEAKQLDPLIVLEDLGLLADSIMVLMKGISRRLAGYPRTVTFWESSGYREAYLSAMEIEPDRPSGPGIDAPSTPPG